MNLLPTLRHFCSLHSTPGDEGDVFNALASAWQQQGLDIQRLGKYAIVASPGERKKADTLLLVAHADSPGFIVSSITSPLQIEALVLGGISPKDGQRLILKCGDGTRVTGTLQLSEDEDEQWRRSQPLKIQLDEPCGRVQKGDRLCWVPVWEEEGDLVHATFLDNRIGCALVAEWYTQCANALPNYNVILAATAMEEMNGFGANVLAHHIHADAVIVLDITYENEKQAITMGQGPVITLSDASALLSPAERDQLLALDLPLQTEVYNTSGTDARAFPTLGHTIPVIPLLLATRGNHSPRETLHREDLAQWDAAIIAIAQALFNIRS